MKRHLLMCGSLAALLLGLARLAPGQGFMINQPRRAGDLNLFPDLNDTLAYYYVVDKVRLAMRPDSTPEFSFLRYVQNVRGADQPAPREGIGGGIVHALVTLGVTDEQLRDAQRELRRTHPQARIAGPVMFTSGKFTLISSVRDPQGGFSKQVLGVGSAPLLQNEKAAISIQLTQLGSQVLWESFHAATPDVSFSFEMEVSGYDAPQHAIIEADLAQIYEHQAFAAGVATTYLGAEIKGAFDDLRKKGVIRLVDVAADANLERLIQTAYDKLVAVIFDAAPPTLPDMAGVSANPQKNILDRATDLLNQRRGETITENAAVRTRNDARRKTAGEAAAAQSTASSLQQRLKEAEAQSRSLDSRAQAERQRVTALQDQRATATGARATGLNTLITGAEAAAKTAEAEAAKAKVEVDSARVRLARAQSEAAKTNAAVDSMEKTTELPGFAAMAVYEMKRTRAHGTFKVDLNKYTTASRTLRFDQNIGDLRQYLDRADFFREVNLDDPLLAQREIAVFLDGFNAADFGQYINFVTIQLRKHHQDGHDTFDEARIDRTNFSGQGNQFRMLYGWQGDNDRRKWLDYDVRKQWVFYGGVTVDDPWSPAYANAVPLVPPYQLRRVSVEGTPEELRAADVRSITAKIFYPVGGVEHVRQVTRTVGKDPVSAQIDFLAPADSFSYSYELSWRLKGERTVTTGRKPSSEAVLYVDELPPH